MNLSSFSYGFIDPAIISLGNTDMGNVGRIGVIVTLDILRKREEEARAKAEAEAKSKEEEAKNQAAVPAVKEQKKPNKKYTPKKKKNPKIPLDVMACKMFEDMLNSERNHVDYFTLDILEDYLTANERLALKFLLKPTIKNGTGMWVIKNEQFTKGIKKGNEIYVTGIDKPERSISLAIQSLKDKKIIFTKDFKDKKGVLYFLNTIKGKKIYDLVQEGKLTKDDCEQLNLVIKRGQKTFFDLDLEKDIIPQRGENISSKRGKYFCTEEKKIQDSEKKFSPLNQPETIENKESQKSLPITDPISIPTTNPTSSTDSEKQKLDLTKSKKSDADEVEKKLSEKDKSIEESLKTKLELETKDTKANNSTDGNLGNKEKSSGAGACEKSPEEITKENILVDELKKIKIYKKQATGFIKTYGRLKVEACLLKGKEEEAAGRIKTDITRWFIGTIPKFEIEEQDVQAQELRKVTKEKQEKELSEKNKMYRDIFVIGTRANKNWSISDWASDLSIFTNNWLSDYREFVTDPDERVSEYLFKNIETFEPQDRELRRVKLGLSGKTEEQVNQIIMDRLEKQDEIFEENLFKLSQKIKFEDLSSLFSEAKELNPELKNSDLIEAFISKFKSKL